MQQPHPPIVIGGYSPAARRRTITQGDGWYGFMLDVEGAAAAIQTLEETAREVERPAHLGPLEISITPRGRLDRDTVERFAEAGVHRLAPMPRHLMLPTDTPDAVRDDVVAFIESTAETLGL